jgi:uncharacterized protein YqeY
MLAEKVHEDLITALKSGRTQDVSALRMLKADITYRSKEVKINALPDSEVIALVGTRIKKYREELKYLTDPSKVSAAEHAITLLEAYLPQQLTLEEIEAAVVTVTTEERNFGKAMKILSGRLRGLADMKVVSLLVKKCVGRH